MGRRVLSRYPGTLESAIVTPPKAIRIQIRDTGPVHGKARYGVLANRTVQRLINDRETMTLMLLSGRGRTGALRLNACTLSAVNCA